ncbi:hypothetical protein C8J56DRAFT_1168068 [Mycena floridula]|nr:hypothetical protein C8J56DRAFT_1168068 [Mycena floridula]
MFDWLGTILHGLGALDIARHLGELILLASHRSLPRKVLAISQQSADDLQNLFHLSHSTNHLHTPSQQWLSPRHIPGSSLSHIRSDFLGEEEYSNPTTTMLLNLQSPALQANRISGATHGLLYLGDSCTKDMDIVSRLFLPKVLRPFSEVGEKLSAALPLKPGDEENLAEMASRGRRR